MKRILKNEFWKLKNGDWMVAFNKSDRKKFDIWKDVKIISKKAKSIQAELYSWNGNIEKTEAGVFQHLGFSGWDFFILNKKDIKKYQRVLMLKELEK